MFAVVEPNYWEGLGKIIVADILLAGDNAVVIALAVRTLPPKQQWWGRIIGSLGAVLLRVIFVAIVSKLLDVPFLKLTGGLLLIWIAIKLLRQGNEEETADHKEASSLWHAIWLIIVADVVMSLDNVIAISGAAGGHFDLVIIGLLFSIPLVVFGSGLLTNLMQKLPWIVWLGAGLLGYVAGEMILTDPKVKAALGNWWLTLLHSIPLQLFAIITLLGWWLARKAKKGQTR